ncbi:hypothetical protein [Acinetobacter sp. ASP199]|uniref:hypothetical protein n=1 Tax=unclassified Acinetobacter TaxID=196816 RepID=UPI001F625AE4|nr:hypothetical protein [Acinetobacter sp. ASP199]UNT59682.1 hypothetical protein IHE35_02275 [Acinetobacter sp. ASP199]
MKLSNAIMLSSAISLGLLLSACDQKKSEPEIKTQDPVVEIEKVEKADVLPYLNIQEQSAKIALPFCETKNCIDLDIQTLDTVDPWLNQWMERKQALVIQDQITDKDKQQNLSLQQAVNAYVKKSDAWQEQIKINKAYQLSMYTRIPYQRNQYVLLQIGVDTEQENVTVKERYYFFVADRRSQKNLTALDIIDPQKRVTMDKIVQDAYVKWLKENSKEVRQTAQKKLYWGQADWFFDQEGIGLHYRGGEIVKDAKQLDIYLTQEQTQQVLKAEVYQHMF